MTQVSNAGGSVGVEQLRPYGIALVGEPPTVQLTIGGLDLGVRVTPLDAGFVLRAELSVDRPQEVDRLTDAALTRPGDTSFAFEGNHLVATRTLAEPTLGVMYDAIFELAKSACSLARYFAQLAEIAGTRNEPTSVVEPAVTTPPASPQKGFRFYVDAPTWMQASSGERVHELVPGRWYQGLEEERGWVRVVTDAGIEGWVPRTAIRLQA